MGGLVGRPLELCGMLVRALGVSAGDGLRFARFVRRISSRLARNGAERAPDR